MGSCEEIIYAYRERERLLCRRLFDRERRPRECFDDRWPDLKEMFAIN